MRRLILRPPTQLFGESEMSQRPIVRFAVEEDLVGGGERP